jgi:multidrug efflux system membrane fusion protein
MTRPRWTVLAVALVAIAVVVWVARSRSAAKAGQAPDPAGQRAIPVTVAAAVRRDVPVYLEGLGSVVALQTVTVRPQVDGRLESVAFREGQPVRKGQLLAQIDPRPFLAQLHQAEGALARDEAQLKNANLTVARDRPLVTQNLIAQQQLDADTAAAGQVEGTVLIDRAAIEMARLNLDYARITSPTDGVTGIRQVDAGNVVHASDPNGIVVVAQLDVVAVIFSLPQDQLGPVAAQLALGPLQVDVLNRDGVTLLGTGRLEVIDNAINAATSTARLKAILPNPRHTLWPNQFVNARLRLETRSGALVVPSMAIQRGPNGTFVYVVGADGTAALRPLAVDLTLGDLALVASGLAEGERVVVEGQNQLRPGAKVAPREVGAPPRGPPPVARDGARTGPAAKGEVDPPTGGAGGPGTGMGGGSPAR